MAFSVSSLPLSLIPFNFCYYDLKAIREPGWMIKDAVKSVLRISSAHNKGRPAGIYIAQILLFF
jgi:hypothetical protein